MEILIHWFIRWPQWESPKAGARRLFQVSCVGASTQVIGSWSLPSQMHQQDSALEVKHPGLELVLI